MQEQIDGLNSKERIFSRKGEVREGHFKDQAKRFEERLREAEMNIDEITKDKNEKIKEIC
jgi:hypothetical protein